MSTGTQPARKRKRYAPWGRVLTAMRNQIKKTLQKLRVAEPLDSADGDFADNGVALQTNANRLATIHSLEWQLNQIELAFKRTKVGTYGICPECRGKIELQRLQAVPWADRCIAHTRKIRPGNGALSYPGRSALPQYRPPMRA